MFATSVLFQSPVKLSVGELIMQLAVQKRLEFFSREIDL